jgi:hypothetical protein
VLAAFMSNGANGTEFSSKLFCPATQRIAPAHVFFVTMNAIPSKGYPLGI